MPVGAGQGVVLDARVSAKDEIEVRVTNSSFARVDLPLQPYYVAVLQDIDEPAWRVDLTKASVRVTATWTHGSAQKTAQNLAQTISSHPAIRTMARARFDGTPSVRVESEAVGSEGNHIFVEVGRVDYNYFVDESGMGEGPYTFRVTDVNGATLEDSGIPFVEAGDAPGREAACERQTDGRCGFTPSAELSACLASPPSL